MLDTHVEIFGITEESSKTATTIPMKSRCVNVLCVAELQMDAVKLSSEETFYEGEFSTRQNRERIEKMNLISLEAES